MSDAHMSDALSDPPRSQFDAVLTELLRLNEQQQTADNKASFTKVLKEMLNQREEIFKEREKSARLEAVLAVKEEMQKKMDKERHEAKEVQQNLIEKIVQQQELLVRLVETKTKTQTLSHTPAQMLSRTQA